MRAAVLVRARLTGPVTALPSRRSRPASRRLAVSVRAHEEDEVLPIWSGRMPEADPAKVHRSPALGGKTLGEELALMQHDYEKKEHDTEAEMTKHLYSANWQGDVYVGSKWNILTVIMGLTFFVPVFGLLFAYLSYGTLWTGHYYGI